MSKKKEQENVSKNEKVILDGWGSSHDSRPLILASPIDTDKKGRHTTDEVSTNAFLNTKELTHGFKRKGANQQLVFEFAIDDERSKLIKRNWLILIIA